MQAATWWMCIVLMLTSVASASEGPVGLDDVRKARWETKSNAAEAYGVAQRHLAKGELEAAERELRTALSIQPGMGVALRDLALVFRGMGRNEDSDAVVDWAVELFPKQPEPLLLRASFRFMDREFRTVVGAANRALVIEPSSIEATWLGIAALLPQGKMVAALNAVTMAREIEDRPELDCLLVGVYAFSESEDKARAAYEKCSRSQGPIVTSARAHLAVLDQDWKALARHAHTLGDHHTGRLAEANHLLEDGRATDAVELVQRVAEVFPDRLDVTTLHASALWRSGDVDGARSTFGKVLSKDTWNQVQAKQSLSRVSPYLPQHVLLQWVQRTSADAVFYYLSSGKMAKASGLLELIDANLGESPDIAAAHASLLVAGGDESGAWRTVGEAFSRWPASLTLRRVMGELPDDTPASVPAPLRELAPVRASQPRIPDAGEHLCRATSYVAENGVPYKVVVKGCPEDFARATEDALYQWMWAPPTWNERSVRGWTVTWVRFSDDDRPRWGGGPPVDEATSPRRGLVLQGRVPWVTRKAIQDALDAGAAELRACYRSHLRWEPTLDGTVTFQFSTSETGDWSLDVNGEGGWIHPPIESCLVENFTEAVETSSMTDSDVAGTWTIRLGG